MFRAWYVCDERMLCKKCVFGAGVSDERIVCVMTSVLWKKNNNNNNNGNVSDMCPAFTCIL